MTHKHISTVMLAAAAVATMTTACKFEQEDYFDETASLRVTHINQQIQDLLVEKSDTNRGNHGWVIQYFVSGTDDLSFEGFNLFGSFTENGIVTLAGNHRFLRGGNANRYTEATSTYDMLAEEGPVLSFNTWNDVLTVFEDPVDPSSAPGSLANDGEGMNGDHNLVLTAIHGDTLVFRGERHSAVVRFFPCDRPWDEYIDAVDNLRNYISNGTLTSYYVTNSTDTMFFSRLNRGYFNYCDRVVDPLNNTVLSCVFTPDGFRLQRTSNLGDNAFQEFTLSADSTCLVNENSDVKVIATWDTYILDTYVNTLRRAWSLDSETLTPAQQQIVEELKAELKKFNNSTLVSLALGVGGNNKGTPVNGLILNYQYTSRNRAQQAKATAGISITRTAYGKATFYADEQTPSDDNLSNFDKLGTDVKAKMMQLAATFNGTYDLTPNNYFLPTGFTISDGSRTFTFGD